MIRSITRIFNQGRQQLPLSSANKPCTSYTQCRYFLMRALNGVLNIYDQGRVNAVGRDRSCAEWILKTGGRIRWVGEEHWVSEYNMLPPDGFEVDPALYRLQDIDASGSVIMVQGFDHLVELKDLKSVKIHNCQYANDGCIKKLHQVGDVLQQLQISGCKKVTDKGLGSLVTLKNLTELHLKDLPGVRDPRGCLDNLKHGLPSCHIIYVDAASQT